MGRKRSAYHVEGDIAYIELTQGYEAIIDTEDLDRVLAYGCWYAIRKGRDASFVYAATNGPRPKKNNRLLHRFIVDEPPDLLVDHKDHNTLDCRKRNLRICTHIQNTRNRSGPQKNNTSGVRGVWWDRARCLWAAGVRVNGRHHHIGRFATIDEAAAAVFSARKRLHGEFAS